MIEKLSKPQENERLWDKERKFPDSRIFFIVDDNSKFSSSLERYFKQRTPDGASFRVFNKASDCLRELSQILEGEGDGEKENQLPTAIFLDRNLEADDENLACGEIVVGEIIKIFSKYGVSRPSIIIAHSSQTSGNQKMLQAGADFSIKKNDFSVYQQFWQEICNYFLEK